jgi:hypothetical protein
MNTDEIIEMARQAGFTLPEGETWYEAFPQCIEAFAKLVADKATDKANARSNTSWTLMCKKMVEDERAACAKVCDARYMGDNSREDMEAKRCAKAIRARS